VPHHCPSTAVKSNLVNARCHCAIAVVALIGVVSLGEPAMLVLQYCDKGSLLGILRKSAPEKEDTDEDPDEDEILNETSNSRNRGGNSKHENKGDLSVGVMIRYCYEISKGCNYMASLKFVHRDM